MSYYTDRVKIDIPNAPNLGHKRTWLWAGGAFLNIVPMAEGNQTANFGAAFSFVIPDAFIFRCFGRRFTRMNLEGDCIGGMSESHNARGRDGTESHEVESFKLLWWTNKARESFGFEVEGALVPIPSTFSYWPLGRDLREFKISASLPLADAAKMFSNEAAAQVHLERALQVQN